MRQVALIVLLAQAGSFVPADSASIGIVDRIMTRAGASDDLTGGQSTFMVEMSEMAAILDQATPRSLLILDEIGRGTGTSDGLSIAWSVMEYIADTRLLGARTLFATHYHELIDLGKYITGPSSTAMSTYRNKMATSFSCIAFVPEVPTTVTASTSPNSPVCPMSLSLGQKSSWSKLREIKGRGVRS